METNLSKEHGIYNSQTKKAPLTDSIQTHQQLCEHAGHCKVKGAIVTAIVSHENYQTEPTQQKGLKSVAFKERRHKEK